MAFTVGNGYGSTLIGTNGPGSNGLTQPVSSVWYGGSQPVVIESVADLAAKLEQLRVVVAGNDPIGAGLWSANANLRWSLHGDQAAGDNSFWTENSWAGWNVQTPWWSTSPSQGMGPGLLELTPHLSWNLVDRLTMAAPETAGQARYLAVEPSNVSLRTLLPIPEVSVSNPDGGMTQSASLQNADLAFELGGDFWADFSAWRQSYSNQPTEINAFWDSGDVPLIDFGALFANGGFDNVVDSLEQDLALTIELSGIERYPLGMQWGSAEFRHQGTNEVINLRLGDHATSQVDIGLMGASMAPAAINVYSHELDVITSFDLEPDTSNPWALSSFLGAIQRASAFDASSGGTSSTWTLNRFSIHSPGSPGNNIDINFSTPGIHSPLGFSSPISFTTTPLPYAVQGVPSNSSPLFEVSGSASPLTLDVLNGSQLNNLIEADLGNGSAGDFLSVNLNLEYRHDPTGLMVRVHGGASPFGESFSFEPWSLSQLRTQIENSVINTPMGGGITIDPASTLDLTLQRVWVGANSVSGTGNADLQRTWIANPIDPTRSGFQWQRTNATGIPSDILASWTPDQLISNIQSLETITITNLFADFDALPYLTGVRAMLVEEGPTMPADAAVAFRYQLTDHFGEGLDQLAILGDSVDPYRRYTLEITAESLVNGFDLEAADITLHYDSKLFNPVSSSDIRIGGALPIANAVSIDHAAGTIRIAAASLSDLAAGSAIGAERNFASISFNFDEGYLQTLSKNPDGSLWSDPLAFTITANSDQTVLSADFIDESNQLNRHILSLRELQRGIGVDGQDVTLYEASINLDEQGDGLILGTQRVIGADAGFTNLLRSGDTLSASSEWLNVGNIQAANLRVNGLWNANARLDGYSLTASTIDSGAFVNGSFDPSNRESTVVTADIKVTGMAGQVLDLSSGILSISADGSDVFTNMGSGSKNLITFQGDLNYDGRVSMKDLAYLNAGAARQQIDFQTGRATAESYARDVDADFSGRIDLADLAVLDQDWGKTLHTGDESFVGSNSLSWSALDSQGTTGDAAWDNEAFKAQNAVEASADYVGSLESPFSVGVIGADGNSSANDGDMQAMYFQDPLPA